MAASATRSTGPRWRRCWRRPAAARLGVAASPLIGDAGWDLVVLVEYPSRQAFLDMIGSAAYQEIGHLRTEALERAELHPMDAIEDPTP